MQDFMEQTGKKRRLQGSNSQGKLKKKVRKVSEFLYSSNLKDLVKKKQQPQSNINELCKTVKTVKKEPQIDINKILQSGFYLGQGKPKNNDRALQLIPSVISTLEQVKEIAKKKLIKVKNPQPNKVTENWVVFCKVTMIWNWKSHVRFFLVDEKGTQTKCQLQKDAADQQYRQFLKSGKYYLFSRGITTIDKENNLLISFPRWARIIPKDNSHFKINPSTTFRIHQVVQHSINSKLNVIGVIKDIKLISVKNQKDKSQYEILFCDPIFKFQIEVKHLVVISQQKKPAIGDVLVLHGFILVEKYGNTLALSSAPQSYHTFEYDTRDQLILSYIKAISNQFWKTYNYDVFRKVKFIQNTLKNLIDFKSNQFIQMFSILDGSVLKVFAADASEQKILNKKQSIQSKKPKIYDLVITLDDDTARINFKVNWYIISSFVQITLEQYKQLCQSKEYLDAYLKKLPKNRIRVKIKSTTNRQGRLQHLVQSIQPLNKKVSVS